MSAKNAPIRSGNYNIAWRILRFSPITLYGTTFRFLITDHCIV